VLDLLAEGLPNKAIAHRLGISDQTVKFHLTSIIGKLGAANRTDAVRRAVRLGLVTL
jgi:DNA-binding NarL/FixJ family response regulator